MEAGEQTGTTKPEAQPSAAVDEKGTLIYGEGKNKKSRSVRRMYLVSDLLAVIGFIGLAVIIMILVFLVLKIDIVVKGVGALFAGALLYWAALFVGDIRRIRRAVRPLRVYEFGIRLPTGSEDDFEHGRPPRFVPYNDILAFYPNEAGANLPYFVVTLRDPDADPLIIPKELVGNWGKFRGAVKDKMQAHKGWHFLKGVGPVFGGPVETDDMHLDYGSKESMVELTWDSVAEEPKSHLRGLKDRSVVTIKLRKGGKLNLLVPHAKADEITGNYRRYVERFWKEPEKEEARWEKLEVPEEERDED